jgi:hypothetical protein
MAHTILLPPAALPQPFRSLCLQQFAKKRTASGRPPDDLPSVDFLDELTASGDGNEEATRPTETLFRAGQDEEAESAPFAAESLGTLRPVGG